MILMTFITSVIVVKFDYCPALIQYIYRIAGKFGGGKAWRIGNLEVLARKSLVNVNDLLDGAQVWRVLIGK